MITIRALMYLLELDVDDDQAYDWAHALLRHHGVDPISDSCLPFLDDEEAKDGGDQ